MCVTDAAAIHRLVEETLRGRRVVKAWLGHGDPLFLEFSRMLCPSKVRDGNPSRVKLDTNFATWSVQGVVSADQEQDDQPLLEEACRSLVDATVTAVAVNSSGALVLTLDAGHALHVVPWPLADGMSDAWCVSLADGRIAAVSNGGEFVIVDKDVPTRDWFPRIAKQGEPSDAAASP
jgi:hypothetical protein